jgi:hypothetical protein
MTPGGVVLTTVYALLLFAIAASYLKVLFREIAYLHGKKFTTYCWRRILCYGLLPMHATCMVGLIAWVGAFSIRISLHFVLG